MVVWTMDLLCSSFTIPSFDNASFVMQSCSHACFTRSGVVLVVVLASLAKHGWFLPKGM